MRMSGKAKRKRESGGKAAHGHANAVPRPEPESQHKAGEAGTATAAPKGTTEWLLLVVKRIPALRYALGVVGLVAVAAISVGFFFGDWRYAFFGGPVAFIGMVLIRIYASS